MKAPYLRPEAVVKLVEQVTDKLVSCEVISFMPMIRELEDRYHFRGITKIELPSDITASRRVERIEFSEDDFEWRDLSAS